MNSPIAPRISVVVPTCDRPERLARCLSALGAADDVVVTDDGSGPAARDLVSARFPAVRWIAGPRRGPAANRNHGARAAQGDWIVFLDDDCEPQAEWLEALARHFDADVVEGKTVCPVASDDPFEETVENLTGDNFWSCNLAIRRAVFEELGGFDEDFREAAGEDMELAWRIRRRGLRTAFAPEAVVAHPVRRVSWADLWRRTLLLRWMVLYRLKTGDGLPLGAAGWRVAGSLVIRETVEVFRVLAQAIVRPDLTRPRSQLFHALRRFVTFPLVLPYLHVWEFRFRRQLQSRAGLAP